MCRSGSFQLLCAQDGNPTLVEAVRIFLGGDVEVDGEDEVGPGEVQVHGQSDLQQQDKTKDESYLLVLYFTYIKKYIHIFVKYMYVNGAFTMCLFSALLCLIQRSCVRGSSVEMEVDRDSLLLAHVAPCSFRPAASREE